MVGMVGMVGLVQPIQESVFESDRINGFRIGRQKPTKPTKPTTIAQQPSI